MVRLQQYIKETTSIHSTSPLPLLNSLFVEQFSGFSPYGSDHTFKTYMKWARRSPALVGFINIIATDILSDQISFEPMKNVSSGRNKIIKAENFWKVNKGLDIAEETLYDMLIDGIGYNWLGKINEIQLKEFCQVIAREMYKEEKEIEFKAERIYQAIRLENSEELAKKLRHIPASTVTIHADQHQPIEYIQRVGTNTKTFQPEEVLVFKLMPFDGKVYPFPPMEAILSEIYLLWLITQNYVSFFENGGHPDKVFILPKELAGSKNHSYLIETLKKYKKVQNKHGNLVFTGDLEIEDLMKVEHQMENKDLALYLVGVLAMMYGMPAGRIPFLIGKSANLGDAGGLADSGYWRKISVWQSKIEEPYNRDLWNPFFRVNMKFARGYKQDEVRETATAMQKTNIVEQRLRLGLWTIEEAGRYLSIDEEIIREAQEQKKERDKENMAKSGMKSGMMSQYMDTNKNIQFEPDKKLKNKRKQDTQIDNQQKAGGKKINP